MIVNVKFDFEWIHAESADEIHALISTIFRSLRSERLVDGRHWAPGDVASFMISDKVHDHLTDVPDNLLLVAVNNDTGFGALIWCVRETHPAPSKVRRHIWVSDNPSPPAFDPRVVADPGEGAFHDRRNVLPVAKVREVVEEFCRVGTGDRPESINWVCGGLDGVRLDAG
ncbi:Imm1 family immunity protein [Dactylosporangium sp. NPDC005572]|uniref:Imm1 family immunity protein n=1 Tax=Dactylosporangium sp. NPDC005572 TaxID=3156889 RepID=UPI0033B47B23